MTVVTVSALPFAATPPQIAAAINTGITTPPANAEFQSYQVLTAGQQIIFIFTFVTP